MEVFALSHEYSHFFAHEVNLESQEEKITSDMVEWFCDDLGLEISRDWGDKNQNWLAFCGIGGIAFFRAVEVSERCASKLRQARPDAMKRVAGTEEGAATDGHPHPADRISTLIAQATQNTSEDQRAAVSTFVKEYDLISTIICDSVLEIFDEVMTA